MMHFDVFLKVNKRPEIAQLITTFFYVFGLNLKLK